MRLFVITIFLLIAFVSCETRKEKATTNDTTVLDFTKDAQKSTFTLSELSDDYQLIPLESTEESLLPYFQGYILDDGIIALSTDKIIRFDTEGKFVRKLITQGEGPEEFKNLSSHDIGPEGRFLYLYEYGKGIRKFDAKDGKLIEKIPLVAFADSVGIYGISGFSMLENGNVAVLRGSLADIPYLVFTQTRSGEFIAGIKRDAIADRTSFAGASPSIGSTEGNDIIYQGSDSLTVQTIMDSTSTTFLQFIVEPPKKEGAKSVLQRVQYMFETDRFIFLLAMMLEKETRPDFASVRMLEVTRYMYDKENEQLLEVAGFLDDNLGIELPEVYFQKGEGGRFLASLQAPLLVEALESALEEKPEGANLKAIENLLSQLEEDGNPVLLTGTLK